MTLLTNNDLNREIIETIDSYSDLAILFNAPIKFEGSNSDNYNEEMDGKPFIYSDNVEFGGTNALFGGAYTEYYDAFEDLLQQDDLLAPSTVVNFDADGRDVYRLDHRDSDSFLLTTDLNEVRHVLENLEYDFVNVAFRVGEGEVYRYFNPLTGEHNYAGNTIEAMAIAQSSEGWVFEGTL